jgi:hypothetical protein
VFNSNGWWGTDALLHTIEPRVRYSWIAANHEDRLPQWTPGVDDVADASRLEYSLTNRVRARTASLPDAETVRWEMFRLTLGHSYDMQTRRVGDAFSTLIVQPAPAIVFRSDVSYDPVAGNVPSATADFAVARRDTTGHVGIRFSEPGKITFLQAGLNAMLAHWVSVRSSVNWDLRNGEFSETRLATDLRWQCWALTVEYVKRARRDDEIRFAVNLLGVGGPIGTSVGLGAIDSSGQK